jgi:hypothetical protein
MSDDRKVDCILRLPEFGFAAVQHGSSIGKPQSIASVFGAPQQNRRIGL